MQHGHVYGLSEWSDSYVFFNLWWALFFCICLEVSTLGGIRGLRVSFVHVTSTAAKHRPVPELSTAGDSLYSVVYDMYVFV